eukprot:CAMPEP_0174879222 /NCGR_PEP_ID=MMETSP1114-20130205/83152_1 /TAXON_ID=312471 /ORGANISM="Neobodo designis, Strain CCAP 1951/1" /LENGTH=896 /DNA_ID=CAMNT_0016114613 /DNA_START=73 /DNA_END=2759 /DNA_ORIENTATION=+
MLRRAFILRMNYAQPGTMESKLSQQRLEQMRQQERLHRTSSRFTVAKMDERQDTTQGTFIGIDLGTTNSCMTYIDPESGMPKVIPSPSGSWVYPTAITFDKQHTVRLCGEDARAVARTSSTATLCSGKRLIGRRYGELGRVSGQLGKTNTLHVNERGEVSVEIAGRSYTVTHIIAIFLRHMKKMAEEYLKRPVDACVISVPAYFTPQQKVATEDAALIAGFDVLEVIDEPSAACLSYSVLRGQREHQAAVDGGIERSLVFDLGGGTLDCALMEQNYRKNTFTLVATHGDPLLGGNDWDNVLANDMLVKWEKKWRIDINAPEHRFGGAVEHRVLQLEAERAKVHFSHSLDDYVGYHRSFHFSEERRDMIPIEVNFTFQDYLRLTQPLRDRCNICVSRILEEARLKPNDIHNILLVGAMTRDPPIRRDLQKLFDRMPVASEECPPDYAVAIGAGVRAGMLQGMFKDLSENTRFVRGTRQSLTAGGMLSKAMNYMWSKMEQNPNAIGHKWRGVVRGLEDEEIEKYARELVEFEATSERRLMLERVEGDANDVMQRVIKNNYRKQGMQEKTVKQLTDQLKFWQYMVRNFHDHEDHLARIVKELNDYMDEIEGYAADNTDAMTSEGTIDFDKLREKRAKIDAEMAEEDLKRRQKDTELTDSIVRERLTEEGMRRAYEGKAEGAWADTDVTPPMPTVASTAPIAKPKPKKRDVRKVDESGFAEAEPEASSALDSLMEMGEAAMPKMAGASEQEAARKLSGTKVLRREVPLPKTATVEELVEKGGSTFIDERKLDFEMSERTRDALFRDYVNDRAWREPPAPPGEKGSWAEVKDRMERGERVGEVVTDGELRAQAELRKTPNARMIESLERIEDEFALDIGLAEDETIRCNSMRVFPLDAPAT